MPRVTKEERERFHDILDTCIDKMNNHKNKNKIHWSELSDEILTRMISIEEKELELAVFTFSVDSDITNELKDIINESLMLFDNIEQRGKDIENILKKEGILNIAEEQPNNKSRPHKHGKEY